MRKYAFLLDVRLRFFFPLSLSLFFCYALPILILPLMFPFLIIQILSDEMIKWRQRTHLPLAYRPIFYAYFDTSNSNRCGSTRKMRMRTQVNYRNTATTSSKPNSQAKKTVFGQPKPISDWL